MNRRNFLAVTSVAAARASLTTASGVSLENKKDKKEESRLHDHFEWNEITISELQEKMASGRLSSEQITGAYLKRIAEMDQDGPAIHAVIELNPDAKSIAKAMDEERKKGKLRGPLHGIPVLLKDNIETADRMMTTAGSLALM